MSASILWTPSGTGKSLNCYTPSAFIKAMTNYFGDPPWDLRESDLPALRAMAAVNPDDKTGFTELAEVVATHGGVKVWAEW